MPEVSITSNVKTMKFHIRSILQTIHKLRRSSSATRAVKLYHTNVGCRAEQRQAIYHHDFTWLRKASRFSIMSLLN